MMMVLLTFAALQTWNSLLFRGESGVGYPEPSPLCINIPLHLRAPVFFTRAQASTFHSKGSINIY